MNNLIIKFYNNDILNDVFIDEEPFYGSPFENGLMDYIQFIVKMKKNHYKKL